MTSAAVFHNLVLSSVGHYCMVLRCPPSLPPSHPLSAFPHTLFLCPPPPTHTGGCGAAGPGSDRDQGHPAGAHHCSRALQPAGGGRGAVCENCDLFVCAIIGVSLEVQNVADLRHVYKAVTNSCGDTWC